MATRKLITRKEAQAKGLKWFFTRTPCPKGHVCERYTANSECKKCRGAYYQRTKEQTRKRRREYGKRWYRATLASRMLAAAKWRATKNQLEFTITERDFTIPSVCPVLNIPIFVSDGKENKGNSPTLDRIDSRKGYAPGNVHVISRRANVIKNDGLPSEHLRIYEYFKDKVVE